jgi:gas vesicle protein
METLPEKQEGRLTSYQLLEEYFDAHLDMQMEDDEDKKAELEDKVENITGTIMEKVENIEHVMVKKDLMKEQLKSQIKVYQDVLTNLKRKLAATDNGWKRLEELIIMLVDNVGEGSEGKTTIEKNGFRYTSYVAPGPLEIPDETEVPQEYTRIKVEVDKARLRKDILANGDTDYAKIPKVKRLKIS